MELRVLGSSGTAPAADNPASGYLVSTASTTLLLDAGPGVAMALLGVMATDDLDAVLLSHRHPDHCSDIFAIFHHLAYGPGAGSDPLAVYSPQDLWEAATAFVGADTDHGWNQAFVWREATGRAKVGDVELWFGRANHSVPTACVRLAGDGASIAYSGDTGPGGDFPLLAESAGTLLCEATYQEATKSDYPYHLSARRAGVLARQAGVDRLILTHLPPTLDPRISIEEAASEFEGETLVAAPGMVIEI